MVAMVDTGKTRSWNNFKPHLFSLTLLLQLVFLYETAFVPNAGGFYVQLEGEERDLIPKRRFSTDIGTNSRYETEKIYRIQKRLNKKKSSDYKPATCSCTCEARTDEDDGGVRDVEGESQIELGEGHWKPAVPTSGSVNWTIEREEPKMGAIGRKNLNDGWKPGTSALEREDWEAGEDGPTAEKQGINLEEKAGEAGKMHDLKDTVDRYKGSWGQGSRYPWKQLPDSMCLRQPCSSDKHCCLRYNICDRSAQVCVDCWYGSFCRSERDCCLRFPICERTLRTSPDGEVLPATSGKCVDRIKIPGTRFQRRNFLVTDEDDGLL